MREMIQINKVMNQDQKPPSKKKKKKKIKDQMASLKILPKL